MSKLSPYFPIVKSRRVVATKRHGNSVALLVESGSTFILSFAEIQQDIHGSHLKLLAQKIITAEEAAIALRTVFADEAKAEPVLLEIASKCEAIFTITTDAAPIVSPFLSTTEIFLTHQKTRGPNL